MDKSTMHLQIAVPKRLVVTLIGASFLPGLNTTLPESFMAATIFSVQRLECPKDIGIKLGKKKDKEIIYKTENKVLKLWNGLGEKVDSFQYDLCTILHCPMCGEPDSDCITRLFVS